MKNKVIIGICIMIMLVSSVFAAVDTSRFEELEGKIGSLSAKEKGELREIAYQIIDDEMGKRIEAVGTPLTEEGARKVLDFKKKLVQRNILYDNAPKTWQLIKSLLPGDTTIHTGKDEEDKDMDGVYRIRTIPESGTTHYLKANQNMVFSVEIEAISGDSDDVSYCWIDEDIQQKESENSYNFRKPIKKPSGEYYKLELKVLKKAKVICDEDAAVIAQFDWRINVAGDYDSGPRVVKFIPEDREIQSYSDESKTFKAIIENENNDIIYEWFADTGAGYEQKGVAGNTFFLDKCDKELCSVKVNVKEKGNLLENGEYEWTVRTEKEKLKVWSFKIPLFPKDEIFLRKDQAGDEVSFTVYVTDKLWQYYEVIDRYEWDFDGDLRYDRTTKTKVTKNDYSDYAKGTYKVTVKVPIVLSNAGKREISEEALEDNPMLLEVHYAQAQTDVTIEGTGIEEEVEAPKDGEEEEAEAPEEKKEEYHIEGPSTLKVGREGVYKLMKGSSIAPPEDVAVKGDEVLWFIDNAANFFEPEKFDNSVKNMIKITPKAAGTTKINVKTKDGQTISMSLTIRPLEEDKKCPDAAESCVDDNDVVHLAKSTDSIKDIREIGQVPVLWVYYNKQPGNLNNVSIGGDNYKFNVYHKCLEVHKESDGNFYFKTFPAGMPSSAKRAWIHTGDKITRTAFGSDCRGSLVELKDVMAKLPKTTPPASGTGTPKVKEIQTLIKAAGYNVPTDGVLETNTANFIRATQNAWGSQKPELVKIKLTQADVEKNGDLLIPYIKKQINAQAAGSGL